MKSLFWFTNCMRIKSELAQRLTSPRTSGWALDSTSMFVRWLYEPSSSSLYSDGVHRISLAIKVDPMSIYTKCDGISRKYFYLFVVRLRFFWKQAGWLFSTFNEVTVEKSNGTSSCFDDEIQKKKLSYFHTKCILTTRQSKRWQTVTTTQCFVTCFGCFLVASGFDGVQKWFGLNIWLDSCQYL